MPEETSVHEMSMKLLRAARREIGEANAFIAGAIATTSKYDERLTPCSVWAAQAVDSIERAIEQLKGETP